MSASETNEHSGISLYIFNKIQQRASISFKALQWPCMTYKISVTGDTPVMI
jgi:hypothetical protein